MADRGRKRAPPPALPSDDGDAAVLGEANGHAAAGSAPPPAAAELPSHLEQLELLYRRVDAAVCFLTKKRLATSLRSVLGLLGGTATVADVSRVVEAAPPGLISLRAMPQQGGAHELFDHRGRWQLSPTEAAHAQPRGASDSSSRPSWGPAPSVHLALPLPELPDIDLDDDAHVALLGVGGDGGGGGTATAATSSAAASSSSSASTSAVAGDAALLDSTMLALNPPGVGKGASNRRLAAFHRALVGRVKVARKAHEAAAKAAAKVAAASACGGKRRKGRGAAADGNSSGGPSSSAAAAPPPQQEPFDLERDVPRVDAPPVPRVGVGAVTGSGVFSSGVPPAGAAQLAPLPHAQSDDDNDEEVALSGSGAGASSSAAAASSGATTTTIPVGQIVAYLRGLPWYAGQLVHVHTTPPRPVAFADLQPAAAAAVPPCVWAALAGRGITRLFRHQADAIAASLAGRHVVLTTPTSSGKSAAFLVPTFTALLAAPATAVAMFIYPTKALAQDQLRALREFLDAAPPELAAAVRPTTLDGDTPFGEREAMKLATGPNLLLANPDILHAAVLPGHKAWRRVLGGLRTVVLDEAHVYRGVFGAHVALTLRRLLRLAARHGAPRPRVTLCSATIANPVGLFRDLIPRLSDEAWAALGGSVAHGGAGGAGAASSGSSSVAAAAATAAEDDDVTVIGADLDGSGTGTQRFLVWNPPMLPRRISAIAGGFAATDAAAVDAAAEAVEAREAAAEAARARKRKRHYPASTNVKALSLNDEGAAAAPVPAIVDSAVDVEPGTLAAAASGTGASALVDSAREVALALGELLPQFGEQPLVPVAAASGAGAGASSSPSSSSSAAAAPSAGRYVDAHYREPAAADSTAADSSDAPQPPAAEGGGSSSSSSNSAPAAAVAPSGAGYDTDATGCVLVHPHNYFRLSPRVPQAARPQSAARESADALLLARLDGARSGAPAHVQPGSYRRDAHSAPYGFGRALTAPTSAAVAADDGGAAATSSSSVSSSSQPHSLPLALPRPPPLPKWVRRFLQSRGIYDAGGDAMLAGAPPLRRRSPIVETAMLTAALVQAGLRTLVFTRVRKVAELLLQYTHDRLTALVAAEEAGRGTPSPSADGGTAAAVSSTATSAAAAALLSRVKSYRAGYLKAHRRAIEGDLFAGRLLAVIATNALELGVDIGSLDVVVLLGYPGSASSLWQQAGRAGRGGRDAAAILVTYDSPLDQSFVRSPAALLARPPEAVHSDAGGNRVLLRLHAMAAAAEAPLVPVDMALFGPRLGDAVAALRREKLLVQADATGLEGDADALTRLLSADAAASAASAAAAAVTDRVSPPAPAAAVAVTGGRSSPSYDAGDDVAAYLLQQPSRRKPAAAQTAASSASSASAPPPAAAAAAAATTLRARGADGRDLGRLHGWALASWAPRPSSAFGLRTIDDVSYEVVVAGSGAGPGGGGEGAIVLDHVEEFRAFWEVHEGAVVLHQGSIYRVVRLDVSAKVAYVTPAPGLPYYTEPRDNTDVNALARERSDAGGLLHYGPAQVSCLVWGYRKIWRRSGMPFEAVDLVLPAVAYDTVGLWGDLPLDVKAWMDGVGLDFLGGCHGAGHAVTAVLPLHVRCDRADVRTECPSPHQHRARPLRFVVYEAHPGGGIGILAAAFTGLHALLADALALVEGCPCEDGCGACVHDPGCREFNTVMDKTAAAIVLRTVLRLPTDAYRAAAEAAASQAAADAAAQAEQDALLAAAGVVGAY